MWDIDHIEIRPAKFEWELWVHNSEGLAPIMFPIGDAIQFHAETERTIGQWLADGPADFHASAPYDQEEDDAAIARTVRERDENDTGKRLTIEELADEIDIEEDN